MNALEPVSYEERQARSYRATMIGVNVPHTCVTDIGNWCSFWNSPGLWDEHGNPSHHMRLTAWLRLRGLI